MGFTTEIAISSHFNWISLTAEIGNDDVSADLEMAAVGCFLKGVLLK